MAGSVRSSGTAMMFIAALLALIDASCTKMVPVPDVDYMETRQTRHGKYLLRTRDNRVFVFDRYATTDSTLVILRVKASGEGVLAAGGATPTEARVAVPWSDVVSLERYDYWNAKTALVLAGGLIVVGGAVAFFVAVSALAHALNGL